MSEKDTIIKGVEEEREAKGRTLSNGSPSMEWLMLKRAACCGRREGREIEKIKTN